MRSQLHHRRLLGAVVALTLLGGVAACGDDDRSDAGRADTRAEAGEPQSGGTLVFLEGSGSGPSLDPVASPGVANGAYDAVAVYDVLLYEAAGTGELTFRLAESLESVDGVTWDLVLRPDVEFSDKTPLDAEAVKFNWERIADPASQSMHASATEPIASMQVVDEVTLRITLSEANPQFPRTVANSLPFVGSPTAIEAEGDQFGSNPVGAGAFVLESWTPGTEQIFVRNPDYWDAPRPYLDKLVIRSVVDSEQRYNTLLTGEGQMLGIESAYNLVPRADQDGFTVAQVPASGGLGLQLNVTSAPFDDAIARQALAHAIDRQGLIDTALGGAVQPFTNLFNDESPLYNGAAEWPQYDADRAQQLLDEYAASHDGPLDVTFFLPDFFKDYGEYLQTQLSEFENLEVAVDLVTIDAFFPRLAAGDFQATIDGPGFADPEPILSGLWGTDAFRNWGGYSNPAMDAALQAGRDEQDDDARRDAYSEIQRIAAEDSPHVWLAPFAYLQLHTPEVHGLEWASWGVALFDRIWLDQ
jgi:peptide/nickel transport system substrate-binding protein